ncbi:clathrin adaptor, mu subunit [Pleurotus eryngii]|uniref:Clathrin adaptor, mu subunit n=1 Tax=Pleurotus eryngii TaxID=5323 RepID=A0A9P5ZWL2_PLEER|nr:clathrin adaptor, mu subunit [Pleurotus eryngii]
MISAFFIFSQKGEVLISRLYRTDFKRSIADVFRIQVISNSDVRSPIITLGSTSFFHVRINNLYVVAVTKNNANAALIFEYCYRFINICKSYFGKIDEESIKNNFVLIYELIDETIDFGYPQNSEIDTLKTYITTESITSAAIAPEESSKITSQATGATSWRRGDVKYKKNEAFVDVIETVNLSMSAKGTVLRADVDGHIQMRAYLSGTPECKFGLNDKLVIDKNERGVSDAVELDDCRFHQCVRLDEFDATRTISFIPPDGEFELMRYRSTSNIKLPLRIIPTVTEIGTTQVSYAVTIKTNFNNKLSATNVVLRIPTPLNTTAVDCKVGSGKAKYVPGENVVVWKVPRIQGGQECTLSATAELTSTTHRQVWARPPIDVDFQVLMFTASGLIVRFLKVFEKSNYHSIKWVRYLTKASGSYQIRF